MALKKALAGPYGSYDKKNVYNNKLMRDIWKFHAYVFQTKLVNDVREILKNHLCHS